MKKMWKRIFSFLFALPLIFTLFSCETGEIGDNTKIFGRYNLTEIIDGEKLGKLEDVFDYYYYDLKDDYTYVHRSKAGRETHEETCKWSINLKKDKISLYQEHDGKMSRVDSPFDYEKLSFTVNTSFSSGNSTITVKLVFTKEVVNEDLFADIYGKYDLSKMTIYYGDLPFTDIHGEFSYNYIQLNDDNTYEMSAKLFDEELVENGTWTMSDDKTTLSLITTSDGITETTNAVYNVDEHSFTMSYEEEDPDTGTRSIRAVYTKR